MWREHIDPEHRDDALEIVDDDAGHPVAHVARRTARPGRGADARRDRRHRRAQGAGPAGRSAARALRRRAPPRPLGPRRPGRAPALDGHRRGDAVPQLRAAVGTAARAATGRRCSPTCARGTAGAASSPVDEALQPVGHVSLADLEWLDTELASLEAAGVKTAMMAPALVDGRRVVAPRPRRARGRRSSSTTSRRCSTSPTNRGCSPTAGTRRTATTVSPSSTRCSSTPPPRSRAPTSS